MAGKKAAGENTKKAAGNAKKAEAAASKQAVKDKQVAAAESEKWSKGSKDTSKGDAAAAKKEEADRKRAEKAALLAEEEASQPSKPKSQSKGAVKKTAAPARGLDLSQLDDAPQNKALGSISASGIDNALDALNITGGTAGTDASAIDRHPERRFKAAYKEFEERRLDEMKDEKGLRRNQKIEQIRKEFEKHPDNPFNQVAGQYNSTREELRGIAAGQRDATEARLTGQ